MLDVAAEIFNLVVKFGFLSLRKFGCIKFNLICVYVIMNTDWWFKFIHAF